MQYREMPGFPEQVEREDSVKTKQERSKRLEIRERQRHGHQGSSVRDFVDVAQGSDEKEAGVPPQHRGPWQPQQKQIPWQSGSKSQQEGHRGMVVNEQAEKA